METVTITAAPTASCLTSTCLASVAAVILVLFLYKKYMGGGTYQQRNIDLSEKYAVVTGGNSGIGAQTVKYLASLNCSVIIGARDKKTAEAAIKECRKINPQAKVDFIPLDLSSRESITSFASAISFDKIDFLINNAGVMAIPKKRLTKQGVEMQWGVNHLGHFLLTQLLWPKVKKSTNFRIVNVSSLAHKSIYAFFGQTILDFDNINFEKDYDPGVSYGRSKLYNVLFTRGLASRIDSNQGKVLSLHPGVVRTELMREMKGEGIGKVMNYIMLLMYPLYWLSTKSPWQGCQTNLHTALSEDVQNGCYYADCKKDSENKRVIKENWEKLWQISEKTLAISFNV